MNPQRELVLSKNGLDIEVCRDLGALAEKVEEWNALLIRSPLRSPMLSYAWVSSFLQHRLKEGQSWFVLFAYRENRLAGILPMVVNKVKMAWMSRTTLRTPDDSHTLGGDTLLVDDNPMEIFQLLITATGRITPGWFAIEFRRVVEDSPTMECLNHPEGIISFREDAGVGYYFPVTGKFEDYFGKLSKSLRGNLRRSENKLSEESELRLIIHERDNATTEELSRFTPLEASGWKGREGSAIECSPELLLFYRTLTTRLSESGMLRWEYLERNDELLACNLSIRFKNLVVIWKLGYAEKHSRFSPGSLLFKAVLEQAFADDTVSEFNLLSDTPWQLNWNPLRRAYFHIYVYPISLYPFVAGYLPRLLKCQIRRSPFLLRVARHLMKFVGKR